MPCIHILLEDFVLFAIEIERRSYAPASAGHGTEINKGVREPAGRGSRPTFFSCCRTNDASSAAHFPFSPPSFYAYNRLYNNIKPPSWLENSTDLHLFKEGIEPKV